MGIVGNETFDRIKNNLDKLKDTFYDLDDNSFRQKITIEFEISVNTIEKVNLDEILAEVKDRINAEKLIWDITAYQVRKSYKVAIVVTDGS